MKRVDPTSWVRGDVTVVKLNTTRSFAPQICPAARDKTETLLLIEVPQALPLIDRMPRRPSVVITQFRGLDAQLLRRVAPSRVICPLLSQDFDALEVLARLRKFRWQGPVDVVTCALTNPPMIEEELRRALPACSISLLHASDQRASNS